MRRRRGPRPPSARGTSGDYAPFSLREAGGRREGFDVEVARAYAHDRGLALRWVPVRWPTLDADFAAGRFDVVMSGVTVRPERSLAGRFSLPVARSGVVVLARGVSDPRAAGTRIAVNAGGHLERVARRLFPAAALRPLAPNAAVREANSMGPPHAGTRRSPDDHDHRAPADPPQERRDVPVFGVPPGSILPRSPPAGVR